MKTTYNKLRGRIVEVFGSQRAFAIALDQSEQTITKKLNDPEGFTQSDIVRWCELLGIPLTEVFDYFFAHLLSKR